MAEKVAIKSSATVSTASKPWDDIQRAYAEQLKVNKLGSEPFGLNAYISHEGTCNSFGQFAYVVNSLINQSVVATIRETNVAGTDTTVFEYTVDIPAGSKKELGCTFYDTSPWDTKRSYQVIGTVP